MTYENILVEREEGVGIVTLNRPDVLNAMNRKLGAELLDAVKTLEADDAHRLPRHHRRRRQGVLGGRRHQGAGGGRQALLPRGAGAARQSAARARDRELRQAGDRHDQRPRLRRRRRARLRARHPHRLREAPGSASSPQPTGGSTPPGRSAARSAGRRPRSCCSRPASSRPRRPIASASQSPGPQVPAARQDDGDREDDRGQPSRCREGGQGAAARAAGGEPRWTLGRPSTATPPRSCATPRRRTHFPSSWPARGSRRAERGCATCRAG